MRRKVRGSKTERPIMRLLDILGKRWSLRILWELRSGRLTFRELRSHCDDMSPTSLNQRLKELREFNLIDHSDEGFGYTPWGDELGEHLLNLNDWSVNWDKNTQHGTANYIDEVFIKINGKQHFLWRVVDQGGEVVDVYLQAKRDDVAAKRFFKRLQRSHGGEPRKIVTDKLRSYGAAHRELISKAIRSEGIDYFGRRSFGSGFQQ